MARLVHCGMSAPQAQQLLNPPSTGLAKRTASGAGAGCKSSSSVCARSRCLGRGAARSRQALIGRCLQRRPNTGAAPRGGIPSLHSRFAPQVAIRPCSVPARRRISPYLIAIGAFSHSVRACFHSNFPGTFGIAVEAPGRASRWMRRQVARVFHRAHGWPMLHLFNTAPAALAPIVTLAGGADRNAHGVGRGGIPSSQAAMAGCAHLRPVDGGAAVHEGGVHLGQRPYGRGRTTPSGWASWRASG